MGDDELFTRVRQLLQLSFVVFDRVLEICLGIREFSVATSHLTIVHVRFGPLRVRAPWTSRDARSSQPLARSPPQPFYHWHDPTPFVDILSCDPMRGGHIASMSASQDR